jgi:hypothetical protein
MAGMGAIPIPVQFVIAVVVGAFIFLEVSGDPNPKAIMLGVVGGGIFCAWLLSKAYELWLRHRESRPGTALVRK